MAIRLAFGAYGRDIVGAYSSPDSSDAIYARSELVHQAVRYALREVGTSPREVLVCSLCRQYVADAANEFFEQHATDAIRRVTFEPVRKE